MEHTTEECDCKGRQCKDCQEVKCLGHYKMYSTRNLTLKPRCRNCDNERKYAWARANPEKRRESQRKNQQGRAYKSRHVSEHLRQLRIKNASRWNKKHPDIMALHRSKWRKEHPEMMKVYGARRRALHIEGGKNYTAEEWLTLIKFYDYTCLCCGKREPEIKLTADHVIPLRKKGLNAISNIQPLCVSCNCRKWTKIIDFRIGYK